MASHDAPRVVIIGGGLSGLVAADALQAAHPALNVTVLESAPRLGGRTHAIPLATQPAVTVDVGGQWVGPDQTAALSVVSRFGIQLMPQYNRGKRALVLNGKLSSYTGLIPSASLSALVDAQAILLALKSYQLIAHMFPSGAAARRWDSSTVEDFLRASMWTNQGRALVRIVVQALFGLEPAQVSMLALLRYVNASGGSVEKMTEMDGKSLQAWTLVGGTQQMSQKLAAAIVARRGGEVRLNSRVTAIRRDAGRATSLLTVVIDGGAEITCDHVILCVPPPNARLIAYDPPLPPHRIELMNSSVMGGILKVLVVYRTPFWRLGGWSGEVIVDVATDPHEGPSFNMFDVSAPPPSSNTAAAAATATAESPSSPVVDSDVNAAALLSTVTPGEGGSTVDWWSPPSAAVASAPLLCCVPRVPAAAAFQPKIVPAASSESALRPLGPALVMFLNGDMARKWSGADKAEARRAALIAQLVRTFGPEAAHPVEMIERDWVADVFTKGCPIGSYGAGVLSKFGLARALGEPCWPDEDFPTASAAAAAAAASAIPSASAPAAAPPPAIGGAFAAGGEGSSRPRAASARLHFAGTETATISTGFMDGAIRSGQRVAAEVLRELVGKHSSTK